MNPKEGSHTRDWEGFGDLEEGHLLLLGHVKMSSYASAPLYGLKTGRFSTQEATRELFREGLKAKLHLGTTELRPA